MNCIKFVHLGMLCVVCIFFSCRYVLSIGLSHQSLYQRFLFNKNYLEHNAVLEPFPFLTPRNRAAAVVAISSGNVYAQRNLFENAESKFDMASHLDHHITKINASHNWWGKNDVAYIYSRVFDYNKRYNLAPCAFRPYLKNSNLEGSGIDQYPDYEPEFQNGQQIGKYFLFQYNLKLLNFIKDNLK